MTIREVGKDYLNNKKFTYSKVERDSDGFADPNFFLPRRYDLAKLIIQRNGEIYSKTIAGWWDGMLWRGRQVKKTDQIIKWKSLPVEEVVGPTESV